MDENIIKINLVEVASELAHNRMVFSIDMDCNEDSLYQQLDNGDFVYTEEAQDIFNDWYDYYYNRLLELKFND